MPKTPIVANPATVRLRAPRRTLALNANSHFPRFGSPSSSQTEFNYDLTMEIPRHARGGIVVDDWDQEEGGPAPAFRQAKGPADGRALKLSPDQAVGRIRPLPPRLRSPHPSASPPSEGPWRAPPRSP